MYWARGFVFDVHLTAKIVFFLFPHLDRWGFPGQRPWATKFDVGDCALWGPPLGTAPHSM